MNTFLALIFIDVKSSSDQKGWAHCLKALPTFQQCLQPFLRPKK